MSIKAVVTYGLPTALLLIWGLVTAACWMLWLRVKTRASRWFLSLVASLPLVVAAILIAQDSLSQFIGSNAERLHLYNYSNYTVVAIYLAWAILCSVTFLLTARSIPHQGA